LNKNLSTPTNANPPSYAAALTSTQASKTVASNTAQTNNSPSPSQQQGVGGGEKATQNEVTVTTNQTGKKVFTFTKKASNPSLQEQNSENYSSQKQAPLQNKRYQNRVSSSKEEFDLSGASLKDKEEIKKKNR